LCFPQLRQESISLCSLVCAAAPLGPSCTARSSLLACRFGNPMEKPEQHLPRESTLAFSSYRVCDIITHARLDISQGCGRTQVISLLSREPHSHREAQVYLSHPLKEPSFYPIRHPEHIVLQEV
jgi:hypothetical protein